MTAKVVIYSKDVCPYCTYAKELLQAKQVAYVEYKIDVDQQRLKEMLELSGGKRSVPQIFINSTHVGGFDDLKALQDQGKLDSLLAGEGHK